MLGGDIADVGWPECGEIDVMEHIGSEPGRVFGTVHGPGYSGAAGVSAHHDLPGGAAFADGFHLFAVEWEPRAIRWYVDDELYRTVRSEEHTSELQSQSNLVCRLLREKKKVLPTTLRPSPDP